MSAIERQDPTSRALTAIAERECARFRNRNLRQPGRDRRVHAVQLRYWLGGLHLPGPACHQPLDSQAVAGDREAVTLPVDCARCLTREEHSFPPLVALDGGQLPLDLRAEPARRSRPSGPDHTRTLRDNPRERVVSASLFRSDLPKNGIIAAYETGLALPGGDPPLTSS